MKDVVVLPGPSSIELGNSIASCLNVDPVEVELRTFSDGESKITINANLLDKNALLYNLLIPQ